MRLDSALGRISLWGLAVIAAGVGAHLAWQGTRPAPAPLERIVGEPVEERDPSTLIVYHSPIEERGKGTELRYHDTDGDGDVDQFVAIHHTGTQDGIPPTLQTYLLRESALGDPLMVPSETTRKTSASLIAQGDSNNSYTLSCTAFDEQFPDVMNVMTPSQAEQIDREREALLNQGHFYHEWKAGGDYTNPALPRRGVPDDSINDREQGDHPDGTLLNIHYEPFQNWRTGLRHGASSTYYDYDGDRSTVEQLVTQNVMGSTYIDNDGKVVVRHGSWENTPPTVAEHFVAGSHPPEGNYHQFYGYEPLDVPTNPFLDSPTPGEPFTTTHVTTLAGVMYDSTLSEANTSFTSALETISHRLNE